MRWVARYIAAVPTTVGTVRGGVPSGSIWDRGLVGRAGGWGGLVMCMSYRPFGIQIAIVRGWVWVYRSVYAVPTAKHTQTAIIGMWCVLVEPWLLFMLQAYPRVTCRGTYVWMCVFMCCLCCKLILGQPVGVHMCECVCLCVVCAASLSSGNRSGYTCVNVCVCVCVPSWSHFGILSGNGL